MDRKKNGSADAELQRVPIPKSTDEWQDMKDLEFEPDLVDESLEQALGDEPGRTPGRKSRRPGRPEVITDDLEQATGDEPIKIPSQY